METGISLKGRSVMTGLAVAVLLPALAMAAEVDRITVEDPATNAVKFKVTSEGNVTGASIIGAPVDGAVFSIQQGPSEGNNVAKFEVKNAAGVVKIAATPNGSLGIGSAVPNASLDINGVYQVAGTGAITVYSGAGLVTGSGTAFLTEIKVGDTITVAGQTRAISSIASDTSARVSTNFTATATGSAFTYSSKPIIKVTDNMGNSAFSISAGGLFGFGTTAPAKLFELRGADGTGPYGAFTTIRDSSYAGGFILGHARGTSVSPAPLNANDRIGSIFFKAQNGQYSNPSLQDGSSASIEVFTETAAAQNAATGHYYSPGFLVFSTTPADTKDPVERLRVTSAGSIGIGTTAPSQKLEVNGGARLNTTATQPACDSTVRGTFWFTQGGSGVKDSAQVCAKDAANAYAWRTLY